jgi:uncharacterized membrane protein
MAPSLASLRMLANAERWCSKAVAEIGQRWRNDGGMTELTSLLQQDRIHRSVSDGAGEWEYADSSVRDMARFPVFASGLIAIVFRHAALRPSPARNPAAAAREITTMATPGNVTPLAQSAQDAAAPIIIRKIQLSDLHEALRLGWEDFKAVPSHAIILCVIYPVLGLVLARTALGYSVLPLLFPLAAGFALLGPFAALGLYELSRRRGAGEEASAWDAVEVLRSPSFGAMLGLGTLLLALFVTWVATAQAIYVATFGYEAAAGIPDFARRVLTTAQGWELIVVGCGVGFLFALVALCVSVVSFPLMLDRHAGVGDAMVTSLRVVALNPIPMAAWGLIVALLLVLGSLPLFLGLAVVVPLLGHATWHLYRKVIAPDPNPRPIPPRPHRERRSAADFPAALFPWRRKDRG